MSSKKNIGNLIVQLSKYGTVQICKAGLVFTLLMTGKGFCRMSKMHKINKIVFHFTDGDYEGVEAIRNDKTYYCIILKPKN